MSGLEMLHNATIIHGNLKPSNIFITKDKTFKIGQIK
jgi:serine/threonine protein kinase